MVTTSYVRALALADRVLVVSVYVQVSQNPLPPGAPVASSVQLDGYPGRPMAVPLMAGTPRYLMFRNVYNEDLRPPKVIPNASILFQVRATSPLSSPLTLQRQQITPFRCGLIRPLHFVTHL